MLHVFEESEYKFLWACLRPILVFIRLGAGSRLANGCQFIGVHWPRHIHLISNPLKMQDGVYAMRPLLAAKMQFKNF